MDQSLNTAVCKYITYEVISKCDLTKGMSHNRRNTLINNNVDAIMAELGSTGYRSPILAQATSHYGNMIRNSDTDAHIAIRDAIQEGHSPMIAQQLKQLVAVLTAEINEGVAKLKDTHAQVAELESKYATQLKNLLQVTSDKVLDESPIHYETWSNIDVVGPEDQIIRELNLGEDKDTPSLRSLNNYVNSIELQLEKNSDYQNYTPSADLISKIETGISGTSVDPRRFMMYFKDACTTRGVYRHLTVLSQYRHMGMSSDHFTKVQEHVRFLSGWLRTYDKVCTNPALASHVSDKLVHRNVALMHNVVKGMVYAMSYYRYSIWGNALILPSGKVNQDLVTTAYNKGITKDDIRCFLYFTKDKTSHSLMTVDYFLKERDTYQRMLTAEVNDRKLSNRDRERQAVQAAFSNVATRYAKQHGIDNDTADLITGLSSGVAHHGQRSATSGFYKLVQTGLRFNKEEMALFDELGSAYNTIATEDQAVDRRSIEETNLLVVAKLIAQKIVKL